MATTSAAGEDGMSAAIRVKLEAEGASTAAASEEEPEGTSSERVVRKVTVLDPLKLKLLARQDQNRLLTGLRTEQANAKPPASTPAPTAAATPAEPPATTTPADEPASQPPSDDAPAEPPKVTAPAKPAGTLFRRKKVVPVAVAKQISKREKAAPPKVVPKPEPVPTPEPEVVKPPETVQPAEEIVEETSKTPEVVEEPPPEVVSEEPAPPVKAEARELERPTSFRRIKPKVSINIAKTRPRKSILKKPNSGTESEGGGSNEPSKSLEPEETIVLDDDDEEENKAAKERQALEESRKAIEAEERRLIEEEMRKIQERDERIRREDAENERRIAEERRVEEERKRIEVERRMEEQRRIAEEQRISEQKAEESRVEENKSIPNRKSVKIPPDLWKSQLMKMKTNPFRMHSVPDKKTLQEEPPKEAPVTVESATLEESQPPCQEVVNVVKPEEVPGSLVPPPAPVPSSATKEIRRISRLPPSVAMKLMNCVAAGKVVKPKEQIVEPAAPEQPTPEPTKTIRRISKLPPELARKLVQSVEKKAEVVKEVKPEVVAEPKPEAPNKEIRRISKLPPELGRKLVQSIEKKPEVATPEVAAEPKPEAPAKEVRRIARLPAAVAMQLLKSVGSVKKEPVVTEVPKEDVKPEVKPVKEIRRISQLPPDVARKLMNSLKQKQPLKPVPLPIPEVKVEPEPDVPTLTATQKPKSKVHILSQVILPTSTSYNLEELLAGKSAESAPAGGQMPLPLPMPRVRKPVEELDTSRSTVDLNQSAGSSQTEEVIAPEAGERMPLPVQLKEEEDTGETTEEAVEGHFADDDHDDEGEEDVPESADLPSVACEEIIEETIVQEEVVEERAPVVVPVVSQIAQVPISTQPVQYSYNARPMPQPVLSVPRSQPQITYFQHVPNLQQQLQQLPPGSSIVYANSEQVSLPSRPHLSVQRLVLNPASIRSQPPLPHPVRPGYGPAQFVLIRNPQQAPRVRQPLPPQQHLLVPRPTYYQHPTTSTAPPSQQRFNQILVPTPRFMVSSVPPGQPPIQPQQHHHQRPTVNYVIPSLSPQKRAFQPVEPQAPPPIIPKIVIEPPPPSHTPDSPKDLKNFSPCSQAVKDKLREKLKAKMSKAFEPPPQPALPPERPTDRMHFVPIVKPPPLPQQRPLITQIRPIKQYNAGPGRKIYLTKFCVVKPEQQALVPPPITIPPPPPPPTTPKMSYVVQTAPRPPLRTKSIDVFHGFPSASIKSERREFERFRENLDKVVTAVSTAGPNGDEMYIITELDEPAVKEEPVVAAPPRITVRRKTFVVEDSDCEGRAQLLPRVDEEDASEEEKKVQVKVEKVEPVAMVKQESEEEEEGESSDADEDLARQILSIVERERDQLRIDSSPPAKVKRLRKRKKRRKRVVKRKRDDDDSKDMVMELLMKHVNQEALIADIVAAQRKELPVIELSEEDEVREEKPVVRIDSESEVVVSDEEDSGSDIFAKILEPFTSEEKAEEVEEVAAEISGVEPLAEKSAIETIDERTDISFKPSNERKEEEKICDTISSALPEVAASATPQAQRAPKRKLKPTLVNRQRQQLPQPKIQKTVTIGRVTTLSTLKATSDEEEEVEDRAATPASTSTFGADNDSSDPFSDREEAVEAKICAKIVVESGGETRSTPVPAAQVVPEVPVDSEPVAAPQEILQDPKEILRQIAEDWDLEETPEEAKKIAEPEKAEEPTKVIEPEKPPEPLVAPPKPPSMEAPAALGSSRPKAIPKRRMSVRIAGQQRPQRTPERDSTPSVASLLRDWEVTPEKMKAPPVQDLLKEWEDSPVRNVGASPEKVREKSPVRIVTSPVKSLLKEWEETPQKVAEEVVASPEKSSVGDSEPPVLNVTLAEKSPEKVHEVQREKTPVRSVTPPVESLSKDSELQKAVELVSLPVQNVTSPAKNVTSTVKSPLKSPPMPHVLLEKLDISQYKSPEKPKKAPAIEPRILLEKLDPAEYICPKKPVESSELVKPSAEPVDQEPPKQPEPEVVLEEPPKQIEPEFVPEEPPKPIESQPELAPQEPAKQLEPDVLPDDPPDPSPAPSRSVTPSDARPASRSLRSSCSRLSVSRESLPLSVERESARSLRRMTRLSVSRESLPQAEKEPPSKVKVSKQASIKNWLQGTTRDPPPAAPPPTATTRTLRSRVNSVVDVEPAKKKPRGRPKVVKPAEVEPPKEVEVVAEESGGADRRREDAEKEAGADAGALEQEPKSVEPSPQPQPKPKPPSPTISNRVPIPISSDSDDEDAPLSKRRKVLRKRRATTRRTVRDLNANRRLFRSANASLTDSAASMTNDEDAFPIIKSEPLEIPQQDAVPYEAFDSSSGRLLSIVHVQNNQIVHAEDYQEHVFATPEPPARGEKRKRRTKAQIEAEKQAKSKRDPDPLPLDPSAAPNFSCANCGETIPRDSWQDHYVHHNGLTYRVGIDPELNLTEEATAVQIVTRYMKQHRQLQVICEKCGVSKKSALGLVSHRVVCGLTPEQIEASKVACENCGRKMMPVSMTSHLNGHCSVLKRIKQERHLEEVQRERREQDEEDAADGQQSDRVNQLGRVKRRATKRAETKIKTMSCEDLILTVTKSICTDGCLGAWKTQLRKANTARCVFPSCDFTGSSEAEMRHHHEFCPLPCELYECRNCRYQAAKIDPLVKHITAKHMDAVRVNMATATYESSGSEAKVGTTESSDDEGTSGVDENEFPDGTASSGMDDEELRGGGKKKGKGRKRSAIGALLSSRIANHSRGVGYGGREQFSEECEVYREMVLDEVIEVRSSKKEFQYVSREWTVKFRQRFYAKAMLYGDFRPDVDAQFLTFNQVQDYIPSAAQSLRFTMRATNLYNAPIHVPDYAHKWRTLDTFGADVSGHESLFFCGGPIIAMDWVPLPDRAEDRTHQILAVVCKSSHEEFYLAEQMPPQPCLIQIWDVGVLSNATLHKKVENSPPTLQYAIACDFGPIWSLKFCPSGCSNTTSSGDQFDRLGLLAATGSNGDVYIFSLAPNYNHLITNSYRIINLKPVLRLTLVMTREAGSPEYEGHGAVRLAWSKSKHHATIAAGYSNGAVAVWNLNTKSPLLTGQKDATTTLLPIHRVFIPDACITAVDLHFTDDSRFMLVSNADRKLVVYDLQTGYLPTEVASLNARSKVTTACWNTHFPVIAMAFDDVYAMDRCALTFHQTREIGLRLCPLYTFTAEATDMSGSDWLSNYVIGTDGGDVLSHQPQPMVHQMAQKNTAQQKYILTSTMSVKLTDEPTDTSYNMFERNFGLLFSDNDKSSSKMDLKSLQVKSYRRALLQEYPGIRVNQVRWNPNEGAYQFYAVGYQAGFVRVRPFRVK
ncbi:titin-like [Culex pipiens pallens]|uniref:titin-like n=1 Tax=Culex pipiens pallens TaxID=42434 RepID=UPI0019546893|nr:titin-like [Culex pipiens pallens]